MLRCGDGKRGRNGAVRGLRRARSATGSIGTAGSGRPPPTFVAYNNDTTLVVSLIVAVFFGGALATNGWAGDGKTAREIRRRACPRHGHGTGQIWTRHCCADGHVGRYVSRGRVEAGLDEIFPLWLGDEGL